MDTTIAVPWIESAPESLVGAEAEVPVDFMFEEGRENSSRFDCADLLRHAGLRPTRQRLTLGRLLFSKGGRHVTAEMLHAEATSAGIHISKATIYNTLNQFTDAGFLRQIGIDGSKSYFDTNPSGHHHFFVDQEDRLLDVPDPGVMIETLPQPLPGYEIAAIDVVVHLRRKQG